MADTGSEFIRVGMKRKSFCWAHLRSQRSALFIKMEEIHCSDNLGLQARSLRPGVYLPSQVSGSFLRLGMGYR